MKKVSPEELADAFYLTQYGFKKQFLLLFQRELAPYLDYLASIISKLTFSAVKDNNVETYTII
jgi:hypothetical protein